MVEAAKKEDQGKPSSKEDVTQKETVAGHGSKQDTADTVPLTESQVEQALEGALQETLASEQPVIQDAKLLAEAGEEDGEEESKTDDEMIEPIMTHADVGYDDDDDDDEILDDSQAPPVDAAMPEESQMKPNTSNQGDEGTAEAASQPPPPPPESAVNPSKDEPADSQPTKEAMIIESDEETKGKQGRGTFKD